MTTNSSDLGYQAESQACDYLCQHGLMMKSRNYRCRYGEIDLIMQQQHTLVFVEVRYRRDATYAHPATTISTIKQQRLHRTAQHYLQQAGLVQQHCRFDVVTLSDQPQRIEWIKDAF